MDKNGFSEFLTMLLLIVLLVASIVVTQIWLMDYSSGIYTSTESKSSTSETSIERVINSKLYFNNKHALLEITEVSVDDVSCSINDTITPGVYIYDLSSCMGGNSNEVSNVVVYTDKGIFTADFFNQK